MNTRDTLPRSSQQDNQTNGNLSLTKTLDNVNNLSTEADKLRESDTRNMIINDDNNIELTNNTSHMNKEFNLKVKAKETENGSLSPNLTLQLNAIFNKGKSNKIEKPTSLSTLNTPEELTPNLFVLELDKLRKKSLNRIDYTNKLPKTPKEVYKDTGITFKTPELSNTEANRSNSRDYVVGSAMHRLSQIPDKTLSN
jgi:hypothetical protein